MSRVNDTFARLRSEGRTALIPFLTAGYPSLELTAEAVPAMEAAGASIIELGIPFSDPIADGPVIAASMHEALGRGVTPAAVFEMVAGIRRSVSAALVAMVSTSIVSRMGPRRFVEDAADAGFDGLILPDADLQGRAFSEAAEAAAERSMTMSLLVAPTTPPRRLREIVSRCSGFVYLLARAGITGEREGLSDFEPRLRAVRAVTSLPVAVGFGISTPEQVAAVTRAADAAIVGSALVRALGAPDPMESLARLARSLAGGLARRQAAGPRRAR
jgi:tryptophan synthase alpha chain